MIGRESETYTCSTHLHPPPGCRESIHQPSFCPLSAAMWPTRPQRCCWEQITRRCVGDWDHNVQNIIEKWRHSPSISSARLGTQPADSISIPDGGTSFPPLFFSYSPRFSETFFVTLVKLSSLEKSPRIVFFCNIKALVSRWRRKAPLGCLLFSSVVCNSFALLGLGPIRSSWALFGVGGRLPVPGSGVDVAVAETMSNRLPRSAHLCYAQAVNAL